jgi:hypothetical protein
VIPGIGVRIVQIILLQITMKEAQNQRTGSYVTSVEARIKKEHAVNNF